MSESFIPQDIKLLDAAKAFVAATSTESGDHIRPLHRYIAMRLVLEGGFLPEELSPRPPMIAELKGREWYISFDTSVENTKEQVVLGALKSKRIDIVVAKAGIGPLLAISVKGTSKAFRNLVNRTEEAIGDCANIHIMYPGLIYGFVHFLRVTDASDPTLKANDILIDAQGNIQSAVKDYSRILEGLSGRKLVRNDYSRYEGIGLALVRASMAAGESPVMEKFPETDSPISLLSFFSKLYGIYDLRFAYTYSDPAVKSLLRVVWNQNSPALVSLRELNCDAPKLGYLIRSADS